MLRLFKKYWDLFGGVIIGLAISLLSKFQLKIIQTFYSVIILTLVCVGMLKVFKTSIELKPKKTKSAIDKLVSSRKEMKAISIAHNPLKEGEELYNTLVESKKVGKKMIKKLKTFFDKFKGYMLTGLLAITALITQYGGFVNDMFIVNFKGKDINLVAVVTAGLGLIVALLSNTLTKEQVAKITALFSKTDTEKLVEDEIKSKLTSSQSELKALQKNLVSKESELEVAKKDLAQREAKLNTKISLFSMETQLATQEEVTEANELVNGALVLVNEKESEIESVKLEITNLELKIKLLKEKLEA